MISVVGLIYQIQDVFGDNFRSRKERIIPKKIDSNQVIKGLRFVFGFSVSTLYATIIALMKNQIVLPLKGSQ
jgi:hypothetical protein